MCLLVFWSKSEDAFGPGKWKKNFLGLEQFIIPFKHFDVQSQAKATY